MSDRIRRALRNLDAETAVTMVLHAVIPFSTLFWTLWGSFGFWTDVFGSPLLAFGAMIAVESIALIGFVMYVADWSPGSWVRRMRHCLPIIPSFQLLHTLHTVIAPNSFTFDLATRMQWTVDIASWMIAAAFTFIFSVISFGAWESFGQTLRNPYAWRLARIQREFERKQKEIEIQRAQLEAECELARLGALMIRDEKVASLSNEQLSLSAMIPVDEAMLLAKRQRYAAVSEALRRIQFPTSPDVSAPMPLAAPSNGSDSVSPAAPSNGGAPVSPAVPSNGSALVSLAASSNEGAPVSLAASSNEGAPVSLAASSNEGAPVSPAVPSNGGAPVSLAAPSNGIAPVSLAVPSNGGAPVSLAVPSNGIAPVSLAAPSNGIAPVSLVAPSNGIAPVSLVAPSNGIAPVSLVAPSNGIAPVSLAAPSNGSDPVEHIALSEDEEKLIRFACAAYLLGIGASLAYAASQCNVPRTTLRDRVHNAEGATRYVEIACSRLSPQGAAEFHRRSREEEQKFLLQRLHRQEQ
jgi:hypothetical protein